MKSKEYPKLCINSQTLKKVKNFDYLIKMPLDTLTQEKIDELEKQRKMKQKEYDTLFNKTEQTIWKEELKETNKSLVTLIKPIKNNNIKKKKTKTKKVKTKKNKK